MYQVSLSSRQSFRFWTQTSTQQQYGLQIPRNYPPFIQCGNATKLKCKLRLFQIINCSSFMNKEILHSQHSKQESQTLSHSRKQKPSHVKVCCRVKPLLGNEETFDIKIDKPSAEISIMIPRQDTTKVFTFNRIFLEENQSNFVEQCCAPILDKALNEKAGYLIFSYGVTNSGKTYTILGSENEPGILPYLIKKLSTQCEVFVSAIELYNEQFFSLSNKQKLVARENNGFLDFSQCLISEPIGIHNMEQKMKQFIVNRTQNENKHNSKSSRSHAIFKIQAGGVTIGVVDLAGSERSNVNFCSIDETSNINKSLLCLGRCIKALNESPDNQSNPISIPYRESKLTKVLIEYFAAKTEVLMIANINQQKVSYHENMKVLDYAVMAKDIRHCTPDFHYSLSKSMKKSNTKVIDLAEALYKSNSKIVAHKSLKSSRSRIKGHSEVSNKEQYDIFAKTLKMQQLQSYLDQYNNLQESSQHYEQILEEKEDELDRRKMENIKKDTYQSPVPPKIDSRKSIGIGNSERSRRIFTEEEVKQMKEELKKLIEEQRLQNMIDEETRITTSFKKTQREEEDVKYPDLGVGYESKPNESTPVKSQQEKAEKGGFFNEIYESVKKTANDLTSKLLSAKKQLMTSQKKKVQESKKKKKERLEIHYYGQLEPTYIPSQKEKYSDITFSKDSQKEEESEDQPNIEIGIQTDFEDYAIKNSLNEETQQQSELSIIHHLSSESRVSDVSIFNNEVIIEEKKEEENDGDSDETEPEGKKKVPVRRGRKKMDIRDKRLQSAKRVAEARRHAAELCRKQSRTPLKERLRSKKR